MRTNATAGTATTGPGGTARTGTAAIVTIGTGVIGKTVIAGNATSAIGVIVRIARGIANG